MGFILCIRSPLIGILLVHSTLTLLLEGVHIRLDSYLVVLLEGLLHQSRRDIDV